MRLAMPFHIYAMHVVANVVGWLVGWAVAVLWEKGWIDLLLLGTLVRLHQCHTV